MARPSFQPSEEQRRQVKLLVAFGNKQQQIATVLKISDRTLRKHFREELNRGATEANSQIANALFKKAKDGDTTAQIFWLKCRAGWRERNGFEGAAPAAAPFIVAREKEAA
jgi:hypothetical protein